MLIGRAQDQFGEHGLLSFRIDDNAELLKHPLDRITVSKH